MNKKLKKINLLTIGLTEDANKELNEIGNLETNRGKTAATIRLSQRIQTTDDWYPTRNDGTVRMSLFCCNRVNGTAYAIVSVWGDDDTGMEIQFSSESWAECVSKFLQWKKEFYNTMGYTPVTMEKLRMLGFYPA